MGYITVDKDGKQEGYFATKAEAEEHVKDKETLATKAETEKAFEKRKEATNAD